MIIFSFLSVDTSTLSVHIADSPLSSFFKMIGELVFCLYYKEKLEVYLQWDAEMKECHSFGVNY